MTYQLKAIRTRTNNSQAGMMAIQEIWGDIFSGKLPLLYDSEHKTISETSLLCEYSNYASNEVGDYDFTIMAVLPPFIIKLEEDVEKGVYKKYDVTNEDNDLVQCTTEAWQQVWTDSQNNTIQRSFTKDYECSIPDTYSPDGKAHCYLYIAVI